MQKIKMYSAFFVFSLIASVNSEANNGGFGAGNGTDSTVSPLALKTLMEEKSGLSLEEKIYNFWLRAQNSVPPLAMETGDEWFSGLSIDNLGEGQVWEGPWGKSYGPKEKYQKLVLVFKKIQALKVDELEVKPSSVYGAFSKTGNFDSILDPGATVWGMMDPSNLDAPFLGRPDLGHGSSRARSIKPIAQIGTGVVVSSFESRPGFPPVEYRQLSKDILVGVRKMITSTEEYGPCPYAKKIHRMEKQKVSVPGRFGFKWEKEVEVSVFDRWELDETYGVPGVCEVHYLVRTKVD